MKTFPHWRNVGRAMLDARRREGATAPRVLRDNERDSMHIQLAWTFQDGRTVELWRWRSGDGGIDLAVKPAPGPGRPGMFAGLDRLGDAATALRVLAALDLIPADIAYAADERYGRCVKCDRLAQWVPAEGQFAARWCHLDPTRPYHKPEVTG